MVFVPTTGERAKPVFPVDLLLAQRNDWSGATVDMILYQGFASPGASTAGSVWAIRKFTYSGTNPPMQTAVTWTSGTTGHGTFDKVWDDRASYVYE